MPNYVYTIRDQQGKTQRKSSRAENSRVLVSRLRGQGFVVTEIRRADKLSSLKLFRPRVKIDHIALFSRQFATMIGAGVPLTECLDILVKQTENSTLSNAVNEVKNEVEDGGSLAVALAKHPKIFPSLYTSMVKAGEATGAFELIFNQLAELLEKQRDLRNKVKSALFLPVMVLGFCVLITVGLLAFIVPRFAAIFEDVDAKLPGPTQMLINVSHGIRGPKALIFVGAIIILIFVIRKLIKIEKIGDIWDRAKLKLPLFGSLIRKRCIASFARTFGLLENSGVPILESLDIVAETAGNRVMAKAIREARSSIQQGESISKPLAESRVFPAMVTHMIVVGENTGSVETMLNKIADLYEDEVDRTVEGLVKLIEPSMMILVGSLVGTILICLYLPIFNLAGTIATSG